MIQSSSATDDSWLSTEQLSQAENDADMYLLNIWYLLIFKIMLSKNEKDILSRATTLKLLDCFVLYLFSPSFQFLGK